MNAKKYILTALAVLAAAAVLAACGARERTRSADIEKSLEISSRVMASLRQSAEDLNSGLDALRTNPPPAYPDFIAGHRRRIAEYAELEMLLERADPQFEPEAELERLAGRIIGLHRALDLAAKACAEMGVFATWQEVKRPCDRLAQDFILRDMAKLTEKYNEAESRLRNAGPLAVLRMRPAAPPAPDSRYSGMPNILFIVVDTLRADALGAYGGPAANTPFMDSMAEQGVVYENAWAPSAGTYISTTAMFTGMDPFEVNSIGDRDWNSAANLLPAFRGAGYRTAGFSANSIVSAYNGLNEGFDHFHLRYWLPAEVLYSEIISYATYTMKRDRPFFIYAHFIDPHEPYFAPGSAAAPGYEPPPDDFLMDVKQIHRDYIDEGLDPRAHMPPGNVERLRGDYAGEVAYTDRWLGRLMDRLGKMGLLENTLVVLTADHGEALLEHGDVDHLHQLYEELVHVPLILWGSLPEGLRSGERVAEQHSTMELFPSLLVWQGEEVNGSAAGRTGLFSGGGSGVPVFAATDGHPFNMMGKYRELMAARMDNLKFILDVRTGETRVFDLAKDPGETRNLYIEYEYLVDTMKDELLWMRETSMKKRSVESGGPSEKVRDQMKNLGYIK